MTKPTRCDTQLEDPDDAAAAATLPQVGEMIDDRYEVLEELGRGGMGVVVRARDVQLDRVVAVKMIRADLSGEAAIRAFFQREARALATLRSEHVVAIHAFGSHGDAFYFAMELVDGVSLGELLESEARHGHHLPLARALDILRRIAAGLDVVHAAGLLHRDLKPDNVLIERGTGRPVLVDFGLASPRRRGGVVPEEGGVSRDAADESMPFGGTPGYIAPEVWSARGAVTPRADVYSFACMAFEVLAGRPVFEAPSMGDLLARHAVVAPPLASSFRQELRPADGVLGAGLAKDPGDRPRTCGELAAGLERELGAAAIVERVFHPRASASSVPPGSDSSGRLEVIISDPDPVAARRGARAAAFVFHGLPHRVHMAPDARRVLELAAARSPDLLLVDLEAPDVAMTEVLRGLRRVCGAASIRVVALAAAPPSADLAAGLAALGTVELLRKPTSLTELMRAFETLGPRPSLGRAGEPLAASP